MGTPREMVSDLLYALIVGYAQGDAALTEGLLALYEVRYASGVSQRAVCEIGFAEAARRSGASESSIRRADVGFRELLFEHVYGSDAWLTPERMVRQKDTGTRPEPTRPSPGIERFL